MASTGGAAAQPLSYDYAPGGNVTFEGNTVYVGGRRVGSAEDFANSAADLANSPPPANKAAVLKAVWLPLGTFALSLNDKDSDPSVLLQLAISKDGIISGVRYDTRTDETEPVRGRVDKETQRVAFRIGEDEQTVYETGLYNLTQDEVSVLVHSGPERVDINLLVRLLKPENERPTHDAIERIAGMDSPEKRARSRFDLAMMLAKDGKVEKARRWCAEIVTQYPDTRAAHAAQDFLKKPNE
jgi:hypothetical protein